LTTNTHNQPTQATGNTTMTITADILVSREVHYCVSSLVSTLASGCGTINHAQGNTDVDSVLEQALELCSPIADYENAALDAGWLAHGAGLVRHEEHGIYDLTDACAWENLCNEYDIEPYEREIYEHWIVSDWLADKLAERGEKVDKDFCGLTVWARTTTGQGIAQDSVIDDIVREVNEA
jgi:hypothetical protein